MSPAVLKIATLDHAASNITIIFRCMYILPMYQEYEIMIIIIRRRPTNSEVAHVV